MDVREMQKLMARQAEIIRDLVGDLSEDQARWKPDPDRWSILEVVNHLYDEEREDFREHLDMILNRPKDPWSPISPMEWVTERHYNERDLASSLAGFLEERRASLAWLEGLQSPDWDAGVKAPWDALMRAGDMFASWVVHGQWHIQQLVQLRRDYVIANALPYDVRYAGTL